MYQDMTLSCVNCGGSFTFTADDQQFHASRGYQNPKRCPACRQQRRVEQRGGTGGYGAPRTMYDVTCANCGQPAQVPFLPRQERPVYCSNCFSKQRESAPSGY